MARSDAIPEDAVARVDRPAADPRPAVPTAARRGGLQTFSSLRHRDYRIVWIGSLFSSSGQWIQQATLGWLTYQLTDSAFLLGAVNGSRALPLLLLGPFGGVAADRVDRKQLMLNSQVGLMLLTAAFGTLIVGGWLQLWHIFAFSLLSGVGWAFTMPVRQSVIPHLVPRADLMNAIALGSAGFNLSRILGPTLAGILIATVGAGENFYLQAAGLLVVTIMFWQLRIPPIPSAAADSVVANLKEGARFVWHHPTLRTQISLALVPVVVALPYSALMPVFARDVLGQGPAGFGLLMAAPGVGAVVGTLTLASLSSVERKGVLLLTSVGALGVCLLLFSLSRSFVLSLVLLVGVGAVQITYITTNQTLIQLTTPDELRGRVLGIYMLNQGLLPLGSLFAGILADHLGAPAAVGIMGTLLVLIAGAFSCARSLREL